MNKSDIKTKNAVQCSICQSPADLLNSNIYRCQANTSHIGDTFTGIFTDMEYKPKEKQ